jgi:hypothetical protein
MKLICPGCDDGSGIATKDPVPVCTAKAVSGSAKPSVAVVTVTIVLVEEGVVPPPPVAIPPPPQPAVRTSIRTLPSATRSFLLPHVAQRFRELGCISRKHASVIGVSTFPWAPGADTQGTRVQPAATRIKVFIIRRGFNRADLNASAAWSRQENRRVVGSDIQAGRHEPGSGKS